MVAGRAGRPTEQRVFRERQRVRGSSPWVVSLVLDQTVSMEADRPGYGTHPPMARARGIAEHLGEWLDRSGVTCGIFGGWDTGPRPSVMYVHKDYDEPFSREAVRKVHADSFGGFRFGALVRHLSARARRRYPRSNHLVVLVTDASCHYAANGLQPRIKEIGFTASCRTCAARPNCAVEPPRHALRCPDADADTPYMLYPTFYAMADYTHAIRSCPGTECLFAVLDEGFSTPMLDRVFGREGWLLVTTDAAQQTLVERVRRSITRVARLGAHAGAES